MPAMPTPTATTSSEALFVLTHAYQETHRVEFRSEVGDHPLMLKVQLDVSSRAGFKKLEKATHVFTFQLTDATTRPGTPSASDHSSPLATFDSDGGPSAAGNEKKDGEQLEGALAGGSDIVVFVHDRYNGHKELYVNERPVYTVKKECTDGSMNSWALPLSFGRVLLRLTTKLLSSSGFEYTLRLGDHNGVILYKTS